MVRSNMVQDGPTPDPNRRHLGEFDLIARYFSPLAEGFPGALGLKDDTALLTVPPGQDLAVTTDTLVADVHFLSNDPPGLIAKKALRVNLSDLAAMGATPHAYTLNFTLPETPSDAWMDAFAAGLGEDQQEFGVHLAGGDTVASPGPLTLSITAFGHVPAGQALKRSGARPGERILATGTIGDGALGLLAATGTLDGLSAEDTAYLINRYQVPQPRCGLGTALIGRASAAQDVSDGLIADLGHLTSASGVGARIEATQIPLSPAAQSVLEERPELQETLLTGGDDYELLLTVPVEDLTAVHKAAKASGTALSDIGEITSEKEINVLSARGETLSFEISGFRHF